MGRVFRTLVFLPFKERTFRVVFDFYAIRIRTFICWGNPLVLAKRVGFSRILEYRLDMSDNSMQSTLE